MNTLSRIGMACMVAGLGAFLAVAYCLQYGGWWWLPIVSAIVCGSTAWALVAPKAFYHAFTSALRSVHAIKPDWAILATFLTCWLQTGLAFFFTLFCFVIGIITLGNLTMISFGDFEVTAIVIGTVATIISFMIVVTSLDGRLSYLQQKRTERVRKSSWNALKYCNPIAFAIYPFVALYFIGKWTFQLCRWLFWRGGIGKIAWGITGFFKAIGLVVWRTFKWSHNDVRKICFIDTFLGVLGGTLVGFWYWNAFYAGIAGLILGPVLGMVNYQLVSIRWLKLQPRTA